MRTPYQLEKTATRVYNALTGRTSFGYKILHVPSNTYIPGTWTRNVAIEIANICNANKTEGSNTMTIEVHEKDGRWFLQGYVPKTIANPKIHTIEIPPDAAIRVIDGKPCLWMPGESWDGKGIRLPAAGVWMNAKNNGIHGLKLISTTKQENVK